MNKPKYSDVNELSDNEFLALRKERLKDIDTKVCCLTFSNVVWYHTYEYRGVKYDIIMRRYTDARGNVGMNKYGKWFVLEHPEETNYAADLAQEVDEDKMEFLYGDTLHSHNDNQTLEQMFYEMTTHAENDIEWLWDSAAQEIDAKISHLREVKAHLKHAAESTQRQQEL